MVEKTGERPRRFKPGDRVGAAWLHSGPAGNALSAGPAVRTSAARPGSRGSTSMGDMPNSPWSPRLSPTVCPKDRLQKNSPRSSAEGSSATVAQKERHPAGRRLGLYGFGASPISPSRSRSMRAAGCTPFPRSEEHRALALELGAGGRRSGGRAGRQARRAVIFAPVGRLSVNALKNLERGGTVVSAGIHMSPIPEFDYSLLYHERKMSSVANATRNDGGGTAAPGGPMIPIRTTVAVFSLEQAERP